MFTHHTRFADYRHYLGPLAGTGGRSSTAGSPRIGAAATRSSPGEDLAAEIRLALGPRSRPRVVTIPTGIDVAAIAALAAVDPRRAAGWPDDAIVAVTLGRLAAEKSVELVLDAVAAVPGVRLVIIGDGPSGEALRHRAARADLANRVWFAGMLSPPREEALALLRGGDLFLVASRSETQGLVVAEALAGGVPVVAIDAPGIRDAVRAGIDGVLVPPAPAMGCGAPRRRDPRPGRGHAAPGGDGGRCDSRSVALRPRRPHRRGDRPLWLGHRGPSLIRTTPWHRAGCVAIGPAYNAGHARESDGPLRLPPFIDFGSGRATRSRQRLGLRAGRHRLHRPAGSADGPTIAASAARRADSVSRRLDGRPRSRAPAGDIARHSPRPPRLAAGPAAQRARQSVPGASSIGPKGNASRSSLAHRRQPRSGRSQGNARQRRTHRRDGPRETREETGIAVEVEDPLGAISYFFVRDRTASTRPCTSS